MARKRFPVFLMSGRDQKKRKILEDLDPEGKYQAKALLPFLGKRVIDWVVEELRKSQYIGQIYVLGLSKEELGIEGLEYIHVETTTDFPEKLYIGLKYLKSKGIKPEQIVISTSDCPAITINRINQFMEFLFKRPGYDFVIGVVPEEIAEASFPNAKRVVARFKDYHVFPGELYALSPSAIEQGYQIIREIHHRRRKRALWPIIRFIAKKPSVWPLIFKFLLKQATLADGIKIVEKAFNCKADAIVIPDAGFGMDMDLTEDYYRLQEFVKKTKLIKKIENRT